MTVVYGLDCGEVRACLQGLSESEFGGNLIFNRQPEKYGRGVRFTLRVKDSRGPGARLSVPCPWRSRPQRHLVAACWHAHGKLFDRLFNAGATRIVSGGIAMRGPEDNWQDRNVGVQIAPAYFSECCECG